jgi:hypothetical protein
MAIAFFSFLGVVVGASLQYLFTRFLEERRHRQALQTAAYTDYIRAVAESASVNLETDEAQLSARLADAKTRICLYGSAAVIAGLAQFESLGAVIGDNQQREAFMKIVEAMRGGSGGQASHVELILMGESKKKTVRENIYSA